MMNRIIQLNPRLQLAASMVRRGTKLADIGTDHGYLPIHLLLSGHISRAVLSDINRGPLAKAEENVRAAGVERLVSFKLCNGAAELENLGITDYTVCGMGGELIADIIGHAPHLMRENINLVLQPMSKPEVLREYLYSNGFSIDKELFVTDEGKHYVCIMAHYTGVRVAFSAADAYFGNEKFYRDEPSDSARLYLEGKLASLTRAEAGKMRGGEDTSHERALIAELKKRLNIN
jgi:tRNA (adenine22-N1)-methyltransferase